MHGKALSTKGNSMDDLYDMVKDNAGLKKKKAEQYGVGFQLPASVSPVVPNVPKKTVQTRLRKSSVS